MPATAAAMYWQPMYAHGEPESDKLGQQQHGPQHAAPSSRPALSAGPGAPVPVFGMQPIVVLLCLALAFSGCVVTPAHALSSALYTSSTCSTLAAGTTSNVDSGVCFPVGRYGAKAVCDADGRVTLAALYETPSCDIIFISGSGMGDGRSCIVLRGSSSVVWSTKVDCSAPGAMVSSGGSSAGLGAIIGGAVGGVVGLALIVGLVCWLLRQRKQATTTSNLSHMQQFSPPPPAAIYAAYIPPHTQN